MKNSADRVPQVCGNRHAELFDLAGLIGWLKVRFPSSTGFHVQALTGIPASSVENWLARRSRPSAEHLSILLCVFGPALFGAAVLRRPPWLERAVEAERLVEIDAEIRRLEGEKAKLNGRCEA